MSKYGQYCPVAKSLEILGDRWTLLIVRDMMFGIGHFNDLERGLPRISRALLASRLRDLQRAGIVEKRYSNSGRQSTEYQLTQAGMALASVITSLQQWGETWAFDEPTPDELDPILLMWWMRNRVNRELLPAQRVVVQYDFHGHDFRGAAKMSFWLVLTAEDVSLCLTDPGYDIDLLVTADLAVYFKLWAGRISYEQALNDFGITVDGTPSVIRAFPSWFGWSSRAPTTKAHKQSATELQQQ